MYVRECMLTVGARMCGTEKGKSRRVCACAWLPRRTHSLAAAAAADCTPQTGAREANLPTRLAHCASHVLTRARTRAPTITGRGQCARLRMRRGARGHTHTSINGVCATNACRATKAGHTQRGACASARVCGHQLQGGARRRPP